MFLPIAQEAVTCRICGGRRVLIGKEGTRKLRCPVCDKDGSNGDRTTHWTVADLAFLQDIGVDVDELIGERIEEMHRQENMHRDFGDCHGCGAKTYESHAHGCPRESILCPDCPDLQRG